MTVLDEAYERLSSAWLENERGFVNHGPMACEALSVMGLDTEVVAWADRSAQPHRAGTNRAVGSGRITDWGQSLGNFAMLEEWVGHFDRSIRESGWRDTVAVWVPRLMPSMSTKLFHAMIRTAHATRSIDTVETEPRRRELAFSLGYWAARFESRPGASSPGVPGHGARLTQEITGEDVQRQLAGIATGAARRFVSRPDIFTLHGVTGAMAVHLLAPHVPVAAARASVHQLEDAHLSLFGDAVPTVTREARGVDRATLAARAADTGDVHAVKLTEAAFRALDATGDPIFVTAAEIAAGADGPG